MSPAVTPAATRRAIAVGGARRSQSRPQRDQLDERHAAPGREPQASRGWRRRTAPAGCGSRRAGDLLDLGPGAPEDALEHERRHERVRQVAAAVQAQLVPGGDDLAHHIRVAARRAPR